MIVGVNGAGKTTTIGKLAQQFAEQGYKTMVAAGDTFRAAAQSQLGVWAERAGVELFSPPGVTDPAAVAFEALTIAKKKNMDVVIIDTAGRLHTQTHLMEELKKIKRVMAKIDPKAPHKTLLVLDASTGQNALLQAKMFHEALQVDGVILTKMDGTAKGGVVVGLSYELKLPIFFIGVGETAHDLKPFNSVEFVNGILGLEKSVVSH
jgi:fused signal recognition particle receptor